MIFKEKEQFLELYTALNGTAYDNPADLTVTTLENAIYMGMRNDWAELRKASIYEYDEEKHIRQEWEDDMKEGLQQGGNFISKNTIQKGKRAPGFRCLKNSKR